MYKLLTIALLSHAVEGQNIFDAVKEHDTEKIGQILESGDFDINAKSAAGQTPLMFAISVGSFPSFKFLLSKGADAFIQEKEKGLTPLQEIGF